MQVPLSQYQAHKANQTTFQKTHRSRIYLGATIVDGGDGSATFSYSTGQFYAFGYGLNDTVEGINNGAAVTTKATRADTSILKARTPNAGERVAIFGVSVRLSADSDAYLAALLDKRLRFALRMNNKELIDLGCLGDLGGVSAGTSYLLPGPADVSADVSGAPFHPTGSGESKGIFFRDPLIWTAEEGADSNLDILAEITSAVTTGSIARRTAAAAPVEELLQAFTPPTTAGDRGTFIDMFVRLHCEVTSSRGVNQ